VRVADGADGCDGLPNLPTCWSALVGLEHARPIGDVLRTEAARPRRSCDLHASTADASVDGLYIFWIEHLFARRISRRIKGLEAVDNRLLVSRLVGCA
jgi:hypothetical protein